MIEEEQTIGGEEQTYSGQGASIPEERWNVHSFLAKVITHNDTTKLGNLKEEEIGEPQHPIRVYKELALISDKIIGDDILSDYYNSKSEIITSTSLSKDAKLLNLSVLQKRILDVMDKSRKVNKGWFKKKKPTPEEDTLQ